MRARGLMSLLMVAACGDGTDAPVDAQLRAITRTEEIPVGAECPASGVRYLAGLDDDASGTLDDAEIDTTTIVCRALVTHEGDLYVRNAVDAEAVRGINIVTGNLIIDAPTLSAVDLSALLEVHGDLLCRGLAGPLVVPLLHSVGLQFQAKATAYEAPRLVSVGDTLALEWTSLCVATSFPALTTVGGDMTITCGVTQTGASQALYEFPALTTVGGGIALAGQYYFRAPLVARAAFLRIVPTWNANEYGFSKIGLVDLPALETIDGTLSISATNLGQLSLPRLRSATLVSVSRIEARLTEVSLPALESASISVSSVSPLTSLSLPRLRDASTISVEDNEALGGLELPALTSASALTVVDNAMLASLDLPALTALATLTVTDNAQLPTCQAEAIADRTGAARTIERNGVGACAP